MENLKKNFAPVSWILIAILGWVCYHQTLQFAFHFYDEPYIVKNPVIHSLSNWREIWQFNPPRFLTFLTLALNYRLGGANVWGYHLFNILVHIACGWLVYSLTDALLRRIQPSADPFWTLWAAPIFIAHPIQTQAINYVWQRAAALAALFYLITLRFYIQGRSSQIKFPFIWLFAAWVCGLLGFFTKQNSFTLPLAVLGLEMLFFYSKKEQKKSVVIWVPYGLLLLLLLLLFLLPLLIFCFGSHELTDLKNLGERLQTPWHYALIQLSVIRTYFRLFFLPFTQSIDYDYPFFSGFNLDLAATTCLILILFALGFFFHRKNPLVVFGMMIFFLGLAVESSFLPLEDVIFEHRLYLPISGLAMALAGFFSKQVKIKPILLITFIVPWLTFATVQRNKDWKDEISLWSDTLKKAPIKVRPAVNLGMTYYEKREFHQAARYFDMVLIRYPENAIALNNRGLVWEAIHRLDRATFYYSKSLAANLGYIKPKVNLAHLGVDGKAHRGAQ